MGYVNILTCIQCSHHVTKLSMRQLTIAESRNRHFYCGLVCKLGEYAVCTIPLIFR